MGMRVLTSLILSIMNIIITIRDLKAHSRGFGVLGFWGFGRVGGMGIDRHWRE